MAEEPATAPGPAALVGQPRFTPADVRHLIREHWDLDADVEPLESERDQNWALIEAGQRTAVLKVANSAYSPEALDLQIEMMARPSMAGLPVPSHIGTVTGGATVSDGGHQAWMVKFCPGRSMAELAPCPTSVHTDLGCVLGRATVALVGFEHPGAHRDLQWDLAHEMVADREARTPARDIARAVTLDLRHDGSLISTDGPDDNVIKIKPPLTFDHGNADRLVEAIDRSLDRIDAGMPS